MARVDYVALLLRQAADPSIARAFRGPDAFRWSQASTVRQQATAAGTLRMIRSVTRGPKSASIPIRNLTREDVDWLIGHAEELFLYVDHTGRKVYGWWDPPEVSEHEWVVNDRANISLSFHEASFNEAV